MTEPPRLMDYVDGGITEVHVYSKAALAFLMNADVEVFRPHVLPRHMAAFQAGDVAHAKRNAVRCLAEKPASLGSLCEATLHSKHVMAAALAELVKERVAVRGMRNGRPDGTWRLAT